MAHSQRETGWTPQSWQSRPARQMPEYPDRAALERLVAGRRLAVPIYACTGRHLLPELERRGSRKALEASGVTIVADTCVVVTPILQPIEGGVLMTNSGKFAHYAPGNTGYSVLYASLADCVESAVAGRPRISGLKP